ncbi:cupin domain-containing protein [Parageobacillus thermoglucosidasius]|uniref:cupin domain-containing protein n=1 Tax=Parageobacillus thermoglucosidasius TaxID=1426 RepID=UPI0001D18E94|nr:cupin domain-containing protein [Parageobacillus thermoglucosidasius]AEH49773.1 Cupin 2 conserved barrel domain protein [Parageobacillus thermoglucosidasius C56-YS93]
MIVVNTESVKPDNHPAVSLKTLFSEEDLDGGRVKFGVITIPPKTRIPLHETSCHEEDEYSIVVKGSIITWSNDQEYRLNAGDASLIPAGEAHWAYNDGDEECEIVWVLVKR